MRPQHHGSGKFAVQWRRRNKLRVRALTCESGRAYRISVGALQKWAGMAPFVRPELKQNQAVRPSV